MDLPQACHRPKDKIYTLGQSFNFSKLRNRTVPTNPFNTFNEQESIPMGMVMFA